MGPTAIPPIPLMESWDGGREQGKGAELGQRSSEGLHPALLKEGLRKTQGHSRAPRVVPTQGSQPPAPTSHLNSALC